MANEHKIPGPAIAVGVAAAAAAAAGGAYWLYGSKHSAKHRKLAKAWMLKARAEVMENIEKLQDIDKERYLEIVQGVLKNYADNATPEDLARVGRELVSAWNHMQGTKKRRTSAPRAKTKAKKSASKKRRTSKK